MTPYGRLALLAGGTVWAVAIVGVGHFFGWPSAALVAGLAVTVAIVATLEIASSSRPSSEVEKQEARGDDFAIRQRDRAEIERSAARAREE